MTEKTECCFRYEKYGEEKKCAFNEEVTFTHEGKNYCYYHAPLEAVNSQNLRKDRLSYHDFNRKIEEKFEEAERCQHGVLVLAGTVFPGDFRYCGKKVSFMVFLDEAQFHGHLSFNSTLFESSISFAGAQFFFDADFTGSVCKEHALFDRVNFCGEVSFVGANFASASFSSAQFGGYANFSYNPQVPGYKDEWARHFGWIAFDGATFSHGVTFENRIFCDRADFLNTTFTYAPRFFRCKLHPATDFRRTQMLDTSSKWAESCYRDLKMHMRDMGNEIQATLFEDKERESNKNYERYLEELSNSEKMTESTRYQRVNELLVNSKQYRTLKEIYNNFPELRRSIRQPEKDMKLDAFESGYYRRYKREKVAKKSLALSNC